MQKKKMIIKRFLGSNNRTNGDRWKYMPSGSLNLITALYVLTGNQPEYYAFAFTRQKRVGRGRVVPIPRYAHRHHYYRGWTPIAAV